LRQTVKFFGVKRSWERRLPVRELDCFRLGTAMTASANFSVLLESANQQRGRGFNWFSVWERQDISQKAAFFQGVAEKQWKFRAETLEKANWTGNARWSVDRILLSASFARAAGYCNNPRQPPFLFTPLPASPHQPAQRQPPFLSAGSAPAAGSEATAGLEP
jgi:hypothetical protein